MLDLIVLIPDQYLSFYFSSEGSPEKLILLCKKHGKYQELMKSKPTAHPQN